MNSNLVSASEIVLGLTQEGARFAGSRPEARALVGRAVQIARAYCNRLVDDAARHGEEVISGVRAAGAVDDAIDREPPPRPRDGLFCHAMLAGLSIGPHEGANRRHLGAPAYEGLRAWLASSQSRRISKLAFTNDEVLRWCNAIEVLKSGRIQRWHFVALERKSALYEALRPYLKTLDTHEEFPSAAALHARCREHPEIAKLQVRGRELFTPDSAPVTVKAIRDFIRRHVKHGPPSAA